MALRRDAGDPARGGSRSRRRAPDRLDTGRKMRPRALGEEVVMRTGSHHVPAHPGRVGDELDGPSAPARLDALRRLAEPVARAAGMDLESVHLSSVGKRRLLRVVVDAVGGVGVDDMAVVSQTLSAKLDSSGLMR